MFGKLRTRMEDTVTATVRDSTGPLLNVLYAILFSLGAILFALVIRRD